MAANVRVHDAPGWGANEKMTSAQANALDLNAAQSVNRNSTASGTRYLPLSPTRQFESGSELWFEDNPSGRLVTHNVIGSFRIPLRELPMRHQLDSVKLKVWPQPGHGGQPGHLPTMLVRRGYSDGAVTNIGTASHTWVDVATYEAGFDLVASGINEVVDWSQYTYFLTFSNESGANSVDNLVLCSLSVTMTIDHALGGTDLSLWV